MIFRYFFNMILYLLVKDEEKKELLENRMKANKKINLVLLIAIPVIILLMFLQGDL